MKASIKLVTSEKPTADGFPIYVNITHQKKRDKACIGHSFKEFWDFKNQEPLRLHPQYMVLYVKILEYRSKIAQINLGAYTFLEAQNLLFSGSNKLAVSGFLAFFDVVISEKQALGQPCASFGNVKSLLLQYIPGDDVEINSITYEWLNDFVIFKLKDGCGIGGVMSYLRTMRSVYKEAQRRKSLNVKADNPFLGVIKKTTPKPVVHVSADALLKIINFKPKPSTTKPNTFKMHRNIAVWLFQYYIGGHDFVDVALLKWTDVIDGRVKFKRYKLRNKNNGGPLVDNKLFDVALAVIERYGDKKSDRIFSYIPNPILKPLKYSNYRRNINHALKRISGNIELQDAIKTKTPRYVFRTRAGENLIHDLIVMRLQGHTPEGVTYNYQGLISYEVQDAAHLTVIGF